MKYFVAIGLIVTVSSAIHIKSTASTSQATEIEEIIAAINSPSTDSAAAAALKQKLFDLLGVQSGHAAIGPSVINHEPDSSINNSQRLNHNLSPTPMSVGPAIIKSNPISVGPAIINSPISNNAAVPKDILSSPAIPVPITEAYASASAPLVQFILNINQATAEASPVFAAPIIVGDIAAIPVQVVDISPVAPVSPSQIIDPASNRAVNAVSVSPIQDGDVSPMEVKAAPISFKPTVIGTPEPPPPVIPVELNLIAK